MGVCTFSEENISAVDPATLFKALVIDGDNLIPKVVDAVQNVEILEGTSGAPGTIKKINYLEGRCAACKSQRRKCPSDCIFCPYFPPNDPQKFASVHRIYGCSNVGKMLQQIPVQMRAQAVDTLYMEARWRIEDPMYGCVKLISQLHQNLDDTESELAKVKALIAFYKLQISHVNELHQPNLDASQSSMEQFDQFNYST